MCSEALPWGTGWGQWPNSDSWVLTHVDNDCQVPVFNTPTGKSIWKAICILELSLHRLDVTRVQNELMIQIITFKGTHISSKRRGMGGSHGQALLYHMTGRPRQSKLGAMAIKFPSLHPSRDHSRVMASQPRGWAGTPLEALAFPGELLEAYLTLCGEASDCSAIQTKKQQ